MTPPKFLAHLVILCFERRWPKQNTVASLKSKDLPLQTSLYWLLHFLCCSTWNFEISFETVKYLYTLFFGRLSALQKPLKATYVHVSFLVWNVVVLSYPFFCSKLLWPAKCFFLLYSCCNLGDLEKTKWLSFSQKRWTKVTLGTVSYTQLEISIQEMLFLQQAILQ